MVQLHTNISEKQLWLKRIQQAHILYAKNVQNVVYRLWQEEFLMDARNESQNKNPTKTTFPLQTQSSRNIRIKDRRISCPNKFSSDCQSINESNTHQVDWKEMYVLICLGTSV